MKTYDLNVYAKNPDQPVDELKGVVSHAWNAERGFLDVLFENSAALYNLDVVGVIEVPDWAQYREAMDAREVGE